MKTTLVALFIMISLLGCTKEKYKTSGQQIGEELLQLAKSENITLVDISEKGYTTETQSKFTIDGSIIKVNNVYYNLNYLERYQVYQYYEGPKVIVLYFESLQ